MLLARKRDLMGQRVKIDAEISKVDADIAKIDEVAGPAIGGPSARMTGVKELVRSTVRDLSHHHPDHPERDVNQLWDEESVVAEVLRREPLMKVSSVRGSIRNLVSKGEIERQGKRGSYTYRWASPDAEQPSPEDRIRGSLANAGHSGVSEDALVQDVGNPDHTGSLLRQLVDHGAVEKFPIGGGEFHYRIKAKSEEVAEHRTLFDGADAPPA